MIKVFCTFKIWAKKGDFIGFKINLIVWTLLVNASPALCAGTSAETMVSFLLLKIMTYLYHPLISPTHAVYTISFDLMVVT